MFFQYRKLKDANYGIIINATILSTKETKWNYKEEFLLVFSLLTSLQMGNDEKWDKKTKGNNLSSTLYAST